MLQPLTVVPIVHASIACQFLFLHGEGAEVGSKLRGPSSLTTEPRAVATGSNTLRPVKPQLRQIEFRIRSLPLTVP